jgi:hypothetical protein
MSPKGDEVQWTVSYGPHYRYFIQHVHISRVTNSRVVIGQINGLNAIFFSE